VVERAHVTLWALLHNRDGFRLGDAHLRDLVLQTALAIVCQQISLGIEHGDLHEGNLMLVPTSPFRVASHNPRHGWVCGNALGLAVRFIDNGFAASDTIFGPGDVATNTANQVSVKRRNSGGLLFPSEFSDMASVLHALIGRIQSFDGASHAHTFLNHALALLQQEAQTKIGLSVTEANRLIDETGVLPAKYTHVDGRGMLNFLCRLFPP
jgi:hypothetical protein